MFAVILQFDSDRELELVRHLAKVVNGPLTVHGPGLQPLPDAKIEHARSRFSPSALRRLRALGRTLRRRWDERIPLLDSEQQTGSDVTFLLEPWLDAPASSVVYRRRTNVAEYAVVLDELNVAAITAGLCEAGRPIRFIAADATVNTDIYANELIQGTLTLAEFAAFAIPGPAGPIVAGGVSVFHTLFTKYLSNEHREVSSNTGSQITTAIGALIDKAALLEASARVASYHDWFKQKYDAAWTASSEARRESDAELDEFKDYLSGAFDPGGGFNTVLELLQDDHYRIRGLAVFTTAASLHLTLRKVKMLLESVNKSSIAESDDYRSLMYEARRYSASAEKSLEDARNRVASRLARIQGPLTRQVSVPVAGRYGAAGATIQKTMHYFTDGDAMLGEHTDTRFGGCGGEDKGPDVLTAEELEAYRRNAETEVRNEIGFHRDAELATAVAKLQDIVSTYERYEKLRSGEGYAE
jgi:hypothetical protein